MMLFREIAVSLGCIGFCFLTACSLGSSGSSQSNNIQLNFSSSVNKAEKIYILVQPHKQ